MITKTEAEELPVDSKGLVDIRDVTIHTDLPKRERMLDFIRQIGDPYCYRHGKYIVQVSFADTDVTLEERLSNYIASKAASSTNQI